MKNKIYVFTTISLMIIIGAFSCVTQVSKAGDHQYPPYNPLIVDYTWEPNPGYYEEPVDFYGSCSGGTPPYHWSYWIHLPSGMNVYSTDVQNWEYTFHPSSPTNYQVRLTVTDSSSPPYINWKNHSIPIDISYDVYVSDITTSKLVYENNEPIIVYPEIGNLYHVCPTCTVTAQVSFSSGTYTYYDVEHDTYPAGVISLTNPGRGIYYPSFSITSAPYDQDYDNNGPMYTLLPIFVK